MEIEYEHLLIHNFENSLVLIPTCLERGVGRRLYSAHVFYVQRGELGSPIILLYMSRGLIAKPASIILVR